MIRAKAVHTHATLQWLADGRAHVVLEIREAPIRLDGKDPAPFGPLTSRTLVGTFAKDTLVYVDDGKAFSLTCVTKSVAVAGATAVRVREGKRGCEGDQGKWKPGATRKAKALVCGDMTSEMDPSFTFVAPPGPDIEYVWVNDDCSMQGGGYRDVPKDGSIAPVR